MAKASMGVRYEKLDWQLIAERRDSCLQLEQQNPWNICSITFSTQMLPSTDETAAH